MPSNPFDVSLEKIGTFVEGVKQVNSFHGNKNMLALNINSFMAGATDIWKKAKENELIKTKKPHGEASHQDGKIEFVSFSDSGALGM